MRRGDRSLVQRPSIAARVTDRPSRCLKDDHAPGWRGRSGPGRRRRRLRRLTDATGPPLRKGRSRGADRWPPRPCRLHGSLAYFKDKDQVKLSSVGRSPPELRRASLHAALQRRRQGPSRVGWAAGPGAEHSGRRQQAPRRARLAGRTGRREQRSGGAADPPSPGPAAAAGCCPRPPGAVKRL
jgi:hypothetical protein